MKRFAMLTMCAFFPILSAAAWAGTTGFTAGNEFTSADLQGDLRMSCQEGGQNEHAFHTCEANVLDPAEFSYFTTAPGGTADTVTLIATHEDGSTREKTESYDPAKGRSTGSFNLWIYTLFQRPLLHPGVNRIHFKLTHGGVVEREGDFVATVQTGKPRTCDYRFEFSNSLMDCRNSSSACDRYFRDQNWCQ